MATNNKFIPQDASPSPSPSLDPTIQRVTVGEEKKAEQKAKEEKDKQNKERIQKNWGNLVNSVLYAEINSDTDYTKSGPYGRGTYPDNTFANTILQLKRDTELIARKDNTVDIPKFKERYEKNKQALLQFARSWEKKNKRSILDVLSSNVPVRTKTNTFGILETSKTKVPASEYIDVQFLYQIMSDNPDKKQKFITPKTFVTGTVYNDKGSFEQTPETVVNPDIAPDVPTNPDGTVKQTEQSYDGLFAFDQNMVQGQIQYYYKGNGNNMIPVALVAGPNGRYLPHSKDYSTVYAPDGSLITDTGVADNSPQTFSEATSYLINELYKTPDGVKKFKELLIAKNIIPPSSAATAMIRPEDIDKTTFDAIQYLVGAVTAHNVVIANKSGAKAPMWSVQDWLNNMTPLSNTKTETITVHQRINPKDYEISIDKMFQDTIGRGATAEELKHFSESLQNYANANPERSTTTTTEGTTGNTSTRSVSGGVGPEAAAAMMRDEALQNPEAEGYTKGAKYFNWFQQAVNNTLQLGG